MDSLLIDLMQRSLKAGGEFTKKQGMYSQAVLEKRPPADLVAAADACLEAAYPYFNALEALREHFLSISGTEDVDTELDRNGKLIDALTRETEALAKLSYLHSMGHGPV